jgi:hypothetical protein
MTGSKMAGKETIGCDEEVTDSGKTKSREIFAPSEVNASDTAREKAEDKAKAAMAKAIETIKKNYVCDDDDCTQMVISRHLDTKIVCHEASQKDKDTKITENGYLCRATCTWTVTIECEEAS